MLGATPVTTLREPLFHIRRDCDKDLVPSGQTYETDDLHFINICLLAYLAFNVLRMFFSKLSKIVRSIPNYVVIVNNRVWLIFGVFLTGHILLS